MGPSARQKIYFSVDEVYIGVRLDSHIPDLRLILTTGSGKFVGYLNTAFRPSLGLFGRNGDKDDLGSLEMNVYRWIGSQVFADKTLTTPVKCTAGAYKVLVAAQHKLTLRCFRRRILFLCRETPMDPPFFYDVCQ